MIVNTKEENTESEISQKQKAQKSVQLKNVLSAQ